jgi:hypothetical protein
LNLPTRSSGEDQAADHLSNGNGSLALALAMGEVYAREQWMKPGENPPVGLILCAEKDTAEAHYALDNLPNKVLAAEYQTVLPDEKVIVEELRRSRVQLEKERSRKSAV